MVILHIKPQSVSILQTKKSVLSGSETSWASQSPAKPIASAGSIVTIDFLASAIKGVVNELPKLVDKDVVLVLDHSLYKLLRTEIPTEIAQADYHTYLKQEFLKSESTDPDSLFFEMIVKEYENKKFGFVYAFVKSTLATLEQSLALLELKPSAIVPEHMAIYALFEKTLRLDKHEHIMYVQYESEVAEGYYFDTFGPVPSVKPWRKEKVSTSNIESILKDKSESWAKDMPKLNRVVLAGSDSEKIRQDTFTKNIGVWTNPLKRILPHFYQEYLNLLKSKQDSAPLFPSLKLSVLLGGFITYQDGKSFPFQKIGTQKKINIHENPITINHSPNDNMSTQSERKGFRVPKEVILFIVIFAVTFSLFYFIAASKSENGMSIPFLTSPTSTPVPTATPVPPTPTPTVEVKREEVKIKVLNGTGVAGQAGGLKSSLLKAGYIEVLTDNADKYDYTQSVLRIKTGKEYLQSTILEDMKAFIVDPKIESLEESDNADITIVIGKDIK